MSETAKQEAPQRSLVRKLSEVMGEIERIAKNGRNDFHKYAYATEADITAAVRQHMADRHLMLLPDVLKEEWADGAVTKSGNKNKLCTLTVKFTLMDGDSGEEKEFTILGQGEDTGDKATYKAMTGALKYALLKLFMIPTGDDPEQDSDVRHTPARVPPDNRPALPTPQQVLGIAPAALIRDKSTLVSFGKNKGQYFCDLEDGDLQWHLNKAGEEVAKNDTKWHKSNLARLGVIKAEMARRVSPTAEDIGRIQAPTQTAPRVVREVGPVDGEEEIVTPSQRFFALARESGMSGAQLTARAKGVLNKAGGWTHGDIDTLEAALEAVPRR